MPEPQLPDATDDELDELAQISEQDVLEAMSSSLATDSDIAGLIEATPEDDE